MVVPIAKSIRQVPIKNDQDLENFPLVNQKRQEKNKESDQKNDE